MLKGERNFSTFLNTTTTTTTTTAGWYSVVSTVIQYVLNSLWVKSW